MEYVITLIIVVIVIFVVFDHIKNSDGSVKELLLQSKLDEQKCTLYMKITHIGGHPKFPANHPLVFKIRNERIFIEGWYLTPSVEIKLDNLINYEVQTKTEIESNITIPRVLLLGVFSLIAQKQTSETSQFLILTLKEEGVEFQCIFENENNRNNLYDIITELNKLKINYAKFKNNAI